MEKARALRICNELLGKSVGGWTVDGYVGHGGSAVVLGATKQGLSTALKLIDPDLVERFGRNRQVERVKRERMLIGHQEKHLVQIYDAGVCSETNYLFVAMELLKTPNLGKLTANFPRDKIFPVIKQIATAAKFLDDKNIVHRDIKPENISVSSDLEMAKLLDLGVIRPVLEVEDDVVTGNAFLGTTRYSSPEYLMREGDEDSKKGWRALTFYQLGALLHDMIMRRRLFDGIDDPPTRLTDAVRHTVPTIECSDIDPRIVSLAKSCLQKDWRLRLELVNWEDFSDNPRRMDASAVEDKIVKRVAIQVSATTGSTPKLPTRSRRNVLKVISARLATVIQQCCTESGVFPPIRIDEAWDQGDVRITLNAEPSHRHALSESLTVRFVAQIIDEDGLYVRVSGLAGLSNFTFDTAAQGPKEIFCGEISSTELQLEIKSYLLLVLDAAQKQAVFTDSNILAVDLD